MVWARQVTGSLLKRLCSGCQFARASCRRTASGSSWFRGKTVCSSQYRSERCKWESGGVLRMLLHGQAALIIAGSCSLVFADEIASGIFSESDAGGSNSAGLQQVKDGSVISNEHTSKWRIFTDKGRDFFLQGKLNEAEKLFSSALAEAKKGFGERDPHVASACNNLAELYRVRKSFDTAEPLYLHAISILEEAFGPEDIRVGAAFHNLGQFYIVQQKLEEARVCYERAFKIKGRILGYAHPDYAETMFHLGTVLYLQGNLKDAEALIQDSVRILEEGGQGESYACIRKLRYLAKIFITSNDRLEEAENVQRKILHIMELTKGWNSLDTVIAAESLAVTLQSMGKLEQTQEVLERCLHYRRMLLPGDHLQIGANMLSLATVILLKTKQVREGITIEKIEELDRAKELLMNSIRIVQNVLDGTEQNRNIQNYKQHNGNDERTALIILIQSLKALVRVEIAKKEVEGMRGKDLLGSEAEKALRQCIHALREYEIVASTSTSIKLKREYITCLKQLLDLIHDATKNGDPTLKEETTFLKDEIRHLEAEISYHRTSKS